VPLLRFTENIQRHVSCPETTVEGATVGEVLNAFFADRPLARGYVVDEQGELRKHMMVFVNGRLIADRVGLADAVPSDGTVDVMQALSGG
jgi:sulfur-carrier protein